MVTLIATLHPVVLAAWCFMLGLGFGWLVKRAARLITWTRDQRNREALFLSVFNGKGPRS